MKEKRAKGLPVYPGSLQNYVVLAVLIFLEAVTVIAQAYFLARAITALFERTSIIDLMSVIGLFIFVFIMRHLIVQLQTSIASSFATKTTQNLRNQLFETYFQQSSALSQKKGTGYLVTLAMEGIDHVRLYLEIIGIRTIKSIVLPIAIVIYVFQFDRMSAYILVGTVPVVIIFMILLGLAAEKLADRQYATYVRLSNHFVDSLKGLDTLKFLGKSKSHAKKISFVSNEYRKATMRTLRVAFLSSFALDFFSSLSIAFVAVGLGFRLIEGTVLLLPALTILILAPEYFSPIKDVGKDYHATLDGQVAMADINELLLEEDAVRDEGQLLTDDEEIETIHMEDVNVTIGERPILHDINFTVSRGVIAIVGASGAGKSTLIHLLAGRLAYESGLVSINGRAHKSLNNDSWLTQIAYIPQHPYIFPLSLADNIRFYEPEASDERVVKIVEQIGLTPLVATLPNGIHEKIGEGNRSLSGGQEQRIAMARALLSDRPIILLDEPTAHLDVATEYEIKALMLELFSDRFLFIATHRLHWMPHMDHIIVLSNGEVVEKGNHVSLMQEGNVYRDLINWKEGVDHA